MLQQVGSRMIVAMTTDRQLPAFFGITSKYGVPYYAVLASFAFGPLAYLSLGSGGPSQGESQSLPRPPPRPLGRLEPFRLEPLQP